MIFLNIKEGWGSIIFQYLWVLYMPKVARGTIDSRAANNQSKVEGMTPLEQYHKDLLDKGFFEDASQKRGVMLLDNLFHKLVVRSKVQRKPQSFWSSLFEPQNVIIPENGLYFWGGVGRGKTYLVDMFFECLPFEKKLRVHFHRFMQRIHHELTLLSGEQDPLLKIADKIADEAFILCFDEFYVSDITDAMILGTLMQALFERGICLVATSNIAPDDLYRNGLQRARFLPAIALINQHCKVVNLDSGMDYRLRTLDHAEIYHFPLDAQASRNLKQYFFALATPPFYEDHDILINNRKMKAVSEAEGVVYFDFENLCKGARSQLDYIEIARIYHTVLLCDVPQMQAESDDAARRFIAMVDEFYERNVKLIISAQVPLASLYKSGRLSFEFKRCRSRLEEMQSLEYLALAHLP